MPFNRNILGIGCVNEKVLDWAFRTCRRDTLKLSCSLRLAMNLFWTDKNSRLVFSLASMLLLASLEEHISYKTMHEEQVLGFVAQPTRVYYTLCSITVQLVLTDQYAS